MISKREAAERNVSTEGTSSKTNGVECYNCPFFKKSVCKYQDEECCVAFCKQWLADNPVDDWQELKIDDLPRDFLTDTYEVEKMLDGQWCKTLNDGNPIEILVVKNNYPEIKYRYRPRQPEKKQPSHEEIMKHETECVSKMLEHCTNKDLRVLGCAVLYLFKSADTPPEK